MRGMRNVTMRGMGGGTTRAMSSMPKSGSPRLKAPVVLVFSSSFNGREIPKGAVAMRVEALQAGFHGTSGDYSDSGGKGGDGGSFVDQTVRLNSNQKTFDVVVGGSNGAHSIVTTGNIRISTAEATTPGGIGGYGGWGANNVGSGMTDGAPGQDNSASETRAQGGGGGYRQHSAGPGGGGGGGAGPFAGGGGGGGAWNASPGVGGAPSPGGTGQSGQSGKVKGEYAGGNGGVPGGGGGGSVGSTNAANRGQVGFGARGQVRVTFT